MCSPMAAAGISTGLQVAGSYIGQRATAQAAQATMNAQAKAAITEMNWNIMDLEQQRTDAFDNAVAEISSTRLNSMQLNSGVKAAVNETMQGRTANLIVRTTEGDTARAVSSIQDNYRRKSNEVDLNRERQVKSTHQFLENLNASAPKMPSRFTNLLSSAATGLSDYTQARNLMTQQKITGGSKKTTKATTKRDISEYFVANPSNYSVTFRANGRSKY